PPIIAGVGPATILFLEKSTFSADAKLPLNLMAHELAHQWWGNVVPPTLEPGYAPWLSEGLATYSDALYYAFREGAEKGREHLTEYAHLYYEITLHAPDQALDDAWMTSPAYRAIAYEKAARTLHMIHFALGDDAFFRGLRLYAQ
ncbi:MAG: M1 family aminopeptidase, partial [Polyangiaceae bacterium]